MRKGLLVTTLVTIPFLGGCAATIWGNLLALGITVGIFMGTISLGRD